MFWLQKNRQAEFYARMPRSPTLATLSGSLLQLRPLAPQDFEALFAAGSDPLIWEQHPERGRFQLKKFESYFQSGLESKGALIALDQATGEVIGCSRFTNLFSSTKILRLRKREGAYRTSSMMTCCGKRARNSIGLLSASAARASRSREM